MPADDPADEYPLTSFGLAGFDSATNTAFYDEKLLLQINNAAAQITLNRTLNNNASGTNIGVYTISGGVAVPTPDIELQVTSDQARLLYNGEPLIADGQSTDWLALGVNLEDFDGETLIPFVGHIRGGVLEAGDTIGSGFDNISAAKVAVPEPAALGLLSVTAVTLVRRRCRRIA